MDRIAKPWWRESRKAYYATVNGVCHRLGSNLKDANRVLKNLCAKPREIAASGSVLEITDRFLIFSERKAARTHEWYKRHLQSFNDAIGNLLISELKTHHIQEWLDAQKWSDSTRNGAWRAVNRCFRWAVRQQMILHNPATGVEKPSPSRRENPVLVACH